jgi:hypothetical protein
VLDDFDHSSRIESLQTTVFIDQRTMEQIDPSSLPFIESIKPQPLAGNLQGFVRDIHTYDPLELRILDQIPQESAFATPKVQNGLGAAGDEFLKHGRVALRVEPCGQLRLALLKPIVIADSTQQPLAL